MAQKIVILCDEHNRQGVDMPGTSHVVQVDSDRVELDLCEDCFDTLVAPVAQLLKFGRKPDTMPIIATGGALPTTPEETARYLSTPGQCAVSGCNSFVGGMRDHMRRAHREVLLALPGYRGREARNPRKSEQCPHCSYEGPGLGMHLKSKHPEAFEARTATREGKALAS